MPVLSRRGDSFSDVATARSGSAVAVRASSQRLVIEQVPELLVAPRHSPVALQRHDRPPRPSVRGGARRKYAGQCHRQVKVTVRTRLVGLCRPARGRPDAPNRGVTDDRRPASPPPEPHSRRSNQPMGQDSASTGVCAVPSPGGRRSAADPSAGPRTPACPSAAAPRCCTRTPGRPAHPYPSPATRRRGRCQEAAQASSYGSATARSRRRDREGAQVAA